MTPIKPFEAMGTNAQRAIASLLFYAYDENECVDGYVMSNADHANCTHDWRDMLTFLEACGWIKRADPAHYSNDMVWIYCPRECVDALDTIRLRARVLVYHATKEAA